MLNEMLEHLHQTKPIVHNITNYVTVNDCANILLACGASPIMADDMEEVAEITSLCHGLTLNIGTLNQRTIPAMIEAGKMANKLGHPVVLDPVGAGASALRTNTALKLLQEIQLSAIRGNISEIKTLALGVANTRGVDASLADQITQENLSGVVSFAKEFSQKTGAVIVITGEVDIVADQYQAYCIHNGHPMMAKVTGTGCQLSTLLTAYIAANPQQPLKAAVAAVCAMGLCGEIAYNRLTPMDGNASYRTYLIDAIYNLTPEELERGARYVQH